MKSHFFSGYRGFQVYHFPSSSKAEYVMNVKDRPFSASFSVEYKRYTGSDPVPCPLKPHTLRIHREIRLASYIQTIISPFDQPIQNGYKNIYRTIHHYISYSRATLVQRSTQGQPGLIVSRMGQERGWFAQKG